MIPQILLLFPEKNIETSQQMFSVVLQTYFQMLIQLGLIKIPIMYFSMYFQPQNVLL